MAVWINPTEDKPADQRKLTIPIAHRRFAGTRRVRDVPLALGMPTLGELEEEFFGYTDVLLGRQEPPVDNGPLTLLEVSNAYLGRALEVEMMILAAERDRAILKSSPFAKFRTGELRSFITMATKCQDLGSRRLTWIGMLAEAEATGREVPGL